MKIVNVAQMQQAERDSSRFNISLDMLMENAGKAVAEEIHKIIKDLHKQNVLILVGPGNNGGDGLVAARHLYDWGTGRVKVYICGKRPISDANYEKIKNLGIHYREIDNDANLSKFNEWLSEATVVLDAVFGTGKSRPISGSFAQVLARVREEKKHRRELRVIALDLPSGMDADSGTVDPTTPAADNTITLGFPKVGLFNLPGSAISGNITISDIGIPSQLVDNIHTELLTSSSVKSVLPDRPAVSNKGTFGKVLAIVGSSNYIGAAYLACAGSIRVGAGLTTLAIPNSLHSIIAIKLSEITHLPLPEVSPGIPSSESINIIRQQLSQYNVLLMGCGIGQSQNVMDMEKSILFESQLNLPQVILDADGISNLARFPDWDKIFSHDAILTPHPGEMSKLTGKSIEEIQANRIELARESASRWNKVIVLKGAYTVVAAPDGRIRVSPFANAGLASAGTGDVLAGAIAGMAAQGLSLFDAAVCGVYIHGLSGEMVKAELGNAGMIASDLLPVLPKAIRQLKEV